MDLSNIKQPFTITLIGPPLSGKTTFIKSLYGAEFVVVSMDDMLLELHGSNDYKTAYNTVDEKELDLAVSFKIIESIRLRKNVVFDLTNLRIKRRRRNLGQCSLKIFTNIAVVFNTPSEDVLIERNEARIIAENKSIKLSVINTMIDSYEPVDYSEGFSTIIYL